MPPSPKKEEKPLAKVTVWAEEKVGLKNYSNVTYGASLTRYVEDTGIEGLVEEARLSLLEGVEKLMAEERDNVISGLQTAVESS